MSTEIVYVCSSDRFHELSCSLQSLFNSKTDFDSVTVFRVGEAKEDWEPTDPRVRVKVVPPLFGGYFYGNKTYLCGQESDRVVFLDTDTLVLRPLDLLWANRDAGLLARVGTVFSNKAWNHAAWKAAFAKLDCSPLPMFNAGLLVFQNGSHRVIQKSWPKFIKEYLDNKITPPFPDVRMPEQFSLPLALASNGVTCDQLGPNEHCFGWERGTFEKLESADGNIENIVVLHTGTDFFKKYSELLAAKLSLHTRVDIPSPKMILRRSQ
jgi:hypothetical protein